MKKHTRSEQKPLSPIKKWIFIFILIFLGVALSFTAAEVFVRLTKSYKDLWLVTGRKTGKNPMEEWALLDAFSAYRGRPGDYRESKIKKTINKQGFISTPEISVAKRRNTIRIAFLGGSSTAGTGRYLTDEDTWPWKVAQILKKKYKQKRIEFINAALPGYTTFESFGRLWSRIRFFSPDIIVVYHGWNEIYYLKKRKIVSWRTLRDGSWGFRPRKIAIYETHWIDHLIRYSQLLTRIRLNLSTPPIAEKSPPKELKNNFDKRHLEVFRTNLRLIKAATSILEAKLFVAKQATLIVPNLPEKDRKRCRYSNHGLTHDAYVDAFNQIYRIIDDEIEAKDRIDVTQLSGVSEYFYDHIHPTKLGSKEIAKIVARSIHAKIEID